MAITIPTEFITVNSEDGYSFSPNAPGGSAPDGSGGAAIGTGNLMRIGRNASFYSQGGIAFRSVPIPQGASIVSASISIWSHPAFTPTSQAVEWKILGVDVDQVSSYAWSTNFRPGTGGTNFIVNSNRDVLVLTSDQGGPVSIDVPDGTYTGAALATALQTAMNADATLTGSGTITFGVSFAANRFTIDATAGHTIEFATVGSDGGLLFGFSEDAAAAETITSNFVVPGRAPETTASVDWDVTVDTVDLLYVSPDIASVIQEMVNRSGWVTNNMAAIIVRNDGTHLGEAFMRQRILGDASSTRANRFNCTYSIPGGQVMFIQR